jgi:NAD(P)-dependent dehydrogenase (short-subunit alcohol dehydrogenase family)
MEIGTKRALAAPFRMPAAAAAVFILVATGACGGGFSMTGPGSGSAEGGPGGPDPPGPARRVLITGASRGIGLEFARQSLQRGDRVFALARRPEASKDLAALARDHGERLTLVAGDVTDDAAVEAARAKVASVTGAIDLLINNAGTYGTRGGSLENLDLAEVRSVYEVNAVGPLRVTKALLPLLRKGRSAKVISISSQMGSIENNQGGGSWAYRMSKAALNMANRNLAHDLRGDGIACIVLHPGWVRTDMGGPGAPLSAEEAVRSMIRTIDGITLDRTGAFLDRDGKPLPW